jgi:hypothetical protein
MSDMNTISESMREGIASNTPSSDALVFFRGNGHGGLQVPIIEMLQSWLGKNMVPDGGK